MYMNQMQKHEKGNYNDKKCATRMLSPESYLYSMEIFANPYISVLYKISTNNNKYIVEIKL